MIAMEINRKKMYLVRPRDLEQLHSKRNKISWNQTSLFYSWRRGFSAVEE